MRVAKIGANLRQQVVGAAIRRTDAQLPGQLPRRAAQFLGRARQRRFGPFGMGQQPRSRIGQRIALRAFVEQLAGQSLFQPGDPPPHGGRVQLEPAPRARQAFGPRYGQKHAQIIPVGHFPPLCNIAKRFCQSASLPGKIARLE